jgi:hypothetical protein
VRVRTRERGGGERENQPLPKIVRRSMRLTRNLSKTNKQYSEFLSFAKKGCGHI